MARLCMGGWTANQPIAETSPDNTMYHVRGRNIAIPA
jgi:hypothetical protein